MDEYDRVGLVRVHPEDDSQFGDPWEWACAIGTKGNKATIFIADHAPTMKERRAIIALFREVGIDSVEWERKKDDSVVKEFNIEKPSGSTR